MSDPILKIIIRLCSLFSNIDENTDQTRTRDLLRLYLSNYTKDKFIDQFLYVYDFYLNQQKTKKAENFLKKASLRAVKAIRLINSVNQELLLREKFLLVILLLEIVRFKDEILPEEHDFIETLAISFNLDEKDYYNLKNFILKSWNDIPWKKNFILINNQKQESGYESEFKHIYREDLEGNICLLQIKSINAIWFYYDGEQKLFLNNKEITPYKIYAFRKGNSISRYKVGFQNIKLKPIYYSEIGLKLTDDPNFKTVSLEIKDVAFNYRNSTNGIKKFSFKTQSHFLVGIIGPSGSGKSTLLNLLNGTLKPNQGKILINGIDLNQEDNQFKGLIGHVPQDDLLFEELTVYENLYFNAKLCFSDYTENEIHDTVDKVLKDLDLFYIKDLKVGNAVNKIISGGQRKRLNIGMELMREPSILFVDEPTSGLSSNDSINLVNTLREQTLRGKLVVINIHQPSSEIFKLIDQLIVLDEGGHVVYTGDPLDAVVYFKTLSNQINPAEKECLSCGNVNPEVILEIMEEKTINEYGKYTMERKVQPEEWYQTFHEHKKEELDQEVESISELPQVHFKIPNRWKQFLIFSKRNLLSKLSNKQYLLIGLLEAPLLAFILGMFTKYNIGTDNNPTAYVFSKNLNIPAYILMSIIVALFIGLLISAEEIIKDKEIIIREKFLNLSRLSYINSKVIFLFALTAIQSISYVLIGNYILEIKGLSFQYWLILFSTGCFANILGLFISANLKSVIAIYILIPFLIIPQLLLSGTIVKFDKLHSSLTSKEHPPVIADLMPSRWAFEALAVSHFVDNDYEENYYAIDKSISDISYKLNFLIPKLSSLLDEWRTIALTSNDQEEIANLASIVSNTIQKSLTDIPGIQKIDRINELHLLRRIKGYQEYIDFAQNFYAEYLDQLMYKRDLITTKVAISEGGAENYIDYKNDYYNESIANMVLKNDDPEKLFIRDLQIIRKFEPVFMTPSNTSGRAQFYSPVKNLGNIYFKTSYFNAIIIWIISLFIYLLLVFDLLKKINLSFLSISIKQLKIRTFRKK